MSNDVVIRLEGVLWDAASAWTGAVDHVTTRFARVRAFDAAPPAAPGDADADTRATSLATQMAALLAWAGDDIDVVRELTRYFDEHLSMTVRPDRATNQQVRALATSSEVRVVSALPEAAAVAVLRHVGVLRVLATVHGDVAPGLDARALDGFSSRDARVVTAVAAERAQLAADGVRVAATLADVVVDAAAAQ